VAYTLVIKYIPLNDKRREYLTGKDAVAVVVGHSETPSL
jgi:hypothetical protein